MSRETILSLLNKSAGFFEEKGISESRLSAELLLARSLGCRRMDLYLRFEQPVVDKELEDFRALVRRRLTNEPVQYILGDTEFYGLPFKVSPAVLIPRPETEHLVERAINIAARGASADGSSAIRMLDIGTGSGIIPVAVAKHAGNVSITAIDISSEALEVARCNAEENGVTERIEFLEADVLNVPSSRLGGPYDLIVSNPPYIPEDQVAALQPEIREFEPLIAGTDGADGLTFYKRIAKTAGELLNPGGTILLEIGFGQADSVCELFTAAGFKTVEVIDDYAGIPRVVVISSVTTA